MADIDIEVALDARAEIGEGAVWSIAEQALWWVDIPRGELHRFDPATGADAMFPMPTPIGCFALAEAGGVVVAISTGFHHFDPNTGRLTLIAATPDPMAGLRFNDGTVDRQGRFIAGIMPLEGPGEAPRGIVYSLGPDGRARRLMDGFHTINGMAFSPDGRTFYASDSKPEIRTIWAWDYDPERGEIANRRRFFDTRSVRGRPDGGAMDQEGCYWMAGIGGGELVRIRPDGSVDRRIDLPLARPTRVAFGGPDLDVIYVTTLRPPDAPADALDGAVLRLRGAGVRGTPFPLYRGPVAPR